MPAAASLHRLLFRIQQIRDLERCAIDVAGFSASALMERAGLRSFQYLRHRWPNVRRILVVCGIGNNAGDGYVLARCAAESGLDVVVSRLGDTHRGLGEARSAYQAMRDSGLREIEFSTDLLPERELVIDAIFGTGLRRTLQRQTLDAVESINASRLPVLALDVPSGLDADTGARFGAAIRADATLSFVGLKQGLFTGSGPSCTGDVILDDLSIPAWVYTRQPSTGWLTGSDEWLHHLAVRERHAHKGDFGHVLVVGSDTGYSGAARLTGEAAARVGAGLVTIATREKHANTLAGERAELMCRGVEDGNTLRSLIERATVVAIGPGLGKESWGREMLNTVLACELPLVVDADALNLLAGSALRHHDWVLTPHPGEAARLLHTETSHIQSDRFLAVESLCQRYGGSVVLKGAGTLVAALNETTRVCHAGNPGMGSGGMGDVLTGVIAGLIAQHLGSFEAACLGVCLHAEAADIAAEDGERGMLARDLMPVLRRMVNPQISPGGPDI